MTLVVNPEFKDLEAFLLDLPSHFLSQGKVLYKSRNELRTIELPHLILNVKRYRTPFFLNRLAYSFLRPSKACRAFDYALKLREKGIGTPTPIAYLECKNRGLLGESYFVSTHVEEFRMVREFADGSEITGREAVVEALGQFIARLHDVGVLHLDLSVGNILFQQVGHHIQFWVVDLNRMRFCNIDQAKGCKNFERLRGNADFFVILATSYANARGFDPETCLKDILRHQKKSVQSFRAKSERKKRLRKWKLRR